MNTNQYVLVHSKQKENLYGPFVSEILMAEGLMGFETVDFDESPLPSFQPGDLILLTRCSLKQRESETLYRSDHPRGLSRWMALRGQRARGKMASDDTAWQRHRTLSSYSK